MLGDGVLLSPDTKPGNYTMRILQNTPESPPWIQFWLALLIGAICDGDLRFLESPRAELIYEGLGFEDFQIEHLKAKARQRQPVGYQVNLF